MKITKFLLIFILAFLLLISCGAPPENIEESNIIYLVQDQLQKFNKIRDDKERQKKYFKELMESLDLLLVFKKDTSIIIKSREFHPSYDIIAHTLNDNKIITTKDIYITADKKETYFSLNNITWYSTKNDIQNNIEGIKNNYYFDTKIIEDTLYIEYQMGLSLGDNPKKVDIGARPVVRLKKGMIFANKEKEKINIDLKEKILLVPKGTILSGNINVVGNIVKSNSKNGIVTLTSLKDIYIYFDNKKFSLSFDRKNWDVSILSFDIKPSLNVTTVNDNEIYFDVHTSAVYDKTKKSFSIAKLLINAL